MNKIEIDKDSYDELIISKYKLNVLKNIILKQCTLSYNETELRLIHEDKILVVLELLFPFECDFKLTTLKGDSNDSLSD